MKRSRIGASAFILFYGISMNICLGQVNATSEELGRAPEAVPFGQSLLRAEHLVIAALGVSPRLARIDAKHRHGLAEVHGASSADGNDAVAAPFLCAVGGAIDPETTGVRLDVVPNRRLHPGGLQAGGDTLPDAGLDQKGVDADHRPPAELPGHRSDLVQLAPSDDGAWNEAGKSIHGRLLG